MLAAITLVAGAQWSCGGAQLQRLEQTSLESNALERPMDVSVYLPPQWDGRTKLPLVVFLHGGGDDSRSLEERGATDVLDAMINAGQLEPFIMVAPEGEMGFWSNWYDGTNDYEDWVMEDVIPWVQRTYPVSTAREDTHLMGVSMGGAGTLFMALNHLDRFASASVISAPIFTDEQAAEMFDNFFWRTIFRAERVFGPPTEERVATKSVYLRTQSAEDLRGLRLLIGYGRGDSELIRESSAAFHRHLGARGIPHRTLVYDGEHSWNDWRRIFPATLCRQLRAAPCRLSRETFYEIREHNMESGDRVANAL